MGVKESKSLRIVPENHHDKNAEEKNLIAQFLPVYTCEANVNETTFIVKSVISNGAFGDVLKVKCILDDKIYAMKMMKKNQLIENEAVQQAKDEATIQDSIRFHDRIVKTFWFFQNQENIFIVMEYLPCGELFEFWKNTKYFEETVVKVYLAEMALVLDFLHDFGIIYRDLKLENILLDGRGHLKLTDFGLAKRLRKGQRTRTICGTLHYIAPEMAEGRTYGHKSDWWSLGILLYVLLVGQFPLSGITNHMEMFNLMLQTNYAVPSLICYDSCGGQRRVTESMRNLACRLLEMKEEGRMHTAVELEAHSAYRGFNFQNIYKLEMPLPSTIPQYPVPRLSENFNNFDLDISQIPTKSLDQISNVKFGLPHHSNVANFNVNKDAVLTTSYAGKENMGDVYSPVSNLKKKKVPTATLR